MTLKSLVSASALIAGGIFAGRIIGLLREIVIAAQFGASETADIAILLLLIPDLITLVLVGMGTSAALLPAFATRDKKNVTTLFWQALVANVLLFAFISLLLWTQEETIISIFTASDDVSHANMGLAFFITLCSLPVIAATAVMTAFLQHRSRFAAPAFASFIFNMVVLITLWLKPGSLMILAIGIIIAAIIRGLAHVVACARADVIFVRPLFTPWQVRGRLIRTYMSTLSSSICNVLPPFVPYFIVALIGSEFALFNYAYKLLLMPGALGQLVIQLALLPWLVELRKERAMPAHALLQLSWLIGLSLSLALMLAHEPIATLCFGYGKMTEADVAHVAELFALGVWVTPGMLLIAVWQQIFYAHERPRLPLVISVAQFLSVVPACLAGQYMAGSAGVLAGFIIVQTLPVIAYAVRAKQLNFVAHLLPTRSIIMATMAVCCCFFPLMWMYQALEWAPWARFLLAGGIGLVIMLAGFYTSAPVRAWLSERRSVAL